jgi:DNA-binding GntR family transcriptional regulator
MARDDPPASRARAPLAALRRQLRIARAGLYTEARQRLRAMIVQGRLAPGERISEAPLSEALGVSRTPLREALKLLAAEGLIDLRPGRGARVALMSLEETAALFEAVAGIERVAAELAAARLTAGDLRRLVRLQSRMEQHHEGGNLEEYFQLNQQIHGLIVAGAKNPVLKATHDHLLGRVERARYFALASRARWDESVREHRDVLAALEARDGERAGRLLAAHVQRTGEVVGRTLREAAVA